MDGPGWTGGVGDVAVNEIVSGLTPDAVLARLEILSAREKEDVEQVRLAWMRIILAWVFDNRVSVLRDSSGGRPASSTGRDASAAFGVRAALGKSVERRSRAIRGAVLPLIDRQKLPEQPEPPLTSSRQLRQSNFY
jgi:hypothetical protein